ncbi:unnamed protein product [Echinostoma caproni]|uniref:Glyco_transf_64 domain-containing protein n=1 Tax=Echinostoma caproni TaxID=27848 RepID=A0A183AJ13_9TREM|nr:unnamed protein product [Echinostoma caproni]
MIRNYLSTFLHYKRAFILLTVTFTLLFLGINLLLVPTPNVTHMSYTARTQFCAPNPLDRDQAARGHVWLTASNLPFLVDELMRINLSVRNELVELDQRRRDLLAGVAAAQAQVEHVRSLLYEHSRQFMRLRAALHSYELSLRDKHSSDLGVLHQPWPIGHIKDEQQHQVTPRISIPLKSCTLNSCLNWNNCPVNSFLRVCRPHIDPMASSGLWVKEFMRSNHFISDCSDRRHQVCLHVAFTVTEAQNCILKTGRSNPTTCLVILTELAQAEDLLHGREQGHAFLLAAPYFLSGSHFHFSLDFFLPVPFDRMERGFGLNQSSPPPHLIPGSRSHLLGFSAGRSIPHTVVALSDGFESVVLHSLKKLSESSAQLGYRLSMYETQSELLTCWPSDMRQVFSNHMFAERDWFPCSDAVQLLSKSTFGLVLRANALASTELPASLGWNVQLVLCLATGAIPVLLGPGPLPFGEAIPSELWSRAILRLPIARVSQLTGILQSIPEHHRVEMRRQGQIIYRRYFQGVPAQVNSLLLAVGRRLGLPQPPAPAWSSRPAFSHSDFSPSKYYQVPAQSTYQTDLDDFLGPVGPTQPSLRFQANFTDPGGAAHLGLVSVDGADRIIHPFWSYPSTPWDVPMPSDAAHSPNARTNHGLRPINHTINLAGFEFNMNLGGTFPYEQFTIVMLTYDRFEIACRTLEGLLNLPYVHSVVVVWNHPVPPRSDLAWPQLHVPIKVVHMHNNSLNNRFLPHDVIETDCILSVDDDIQLRHDEIVFGFRIWRENRDRLVGFPARAHFWNATTREWYYNSDYTCEFSMVLTGASFFHKYYTYAYTWEMPSQIREMVDRHFNCEDLAMNFLVAHLTRKPPIKATIHWSFTCPYCAKTLHDQPGHYETRSKCLNHLTAWYGYNPLLYSQYRADSLLFKTRIPSTKQKCYKFI